MKMELRTIPIIYGAVVSRGKNNKTLITMRLKIEKVVSHNKNEYAHKHDCLELHGPCSNTRRTRRVIERDIPSVNVTSSRDAKVPVASTCF